MEVKDMKKLLVENNYKITKQREIVFNVLNENKGNHLSPEELHEIAKIWELLQFTVLLLFLIR